MAFYVLKQVLDKKTWLQKNSKTHLNIIKTTGCLLFLIGISKLPLFSVFGQINHYKTGYNLRQLSYETKPNLIKNYTYNVSPRLMEYFIDLETIRSFDNKRYLTIFNSQKPFYIIFPTNKKFYGIHSPIIDTYYEVIHSHQKQNICTVKKYKQNNAELIVARYDYPLNELELKNIQKKLKQI